MLPPLAIVASVFEPLTLTICLHSEYSRDTTLVMRVIIVI